MKPKVFVKNFIEITDQDLAIIMQSRKTLMLENAELWVKKSGTEDLTSHGVLRLCRSR